MPDQAPPELREWFNAARFQQIAGILAHAQPGFDRRRFLALTTTGLDQLALLQRMRRTTESCRATLPGDYLQALRVLRAIAPQIRHNFVGIFLADFVGQYGHGHFEASMAALKFFTPFGSAELAIREFLRRDLQRTLQVMEGWSRDDSEHVRRLASEGCRPRLPWSFRLKALIDDPNPVAPILENLKADPSLYVRKSVANHLNDIAKDHPDWMLARLESWDCSHPHTAWIAKRAARTLLKAGNRRALALLNFTERPKVKLDRFRLTPTDVKLGQEIEFSFRLTSTSTRVQHLAVDYCIHYVKASGATTPKVFKLREVTLTSRQQILLKKRQTFRDFTTRRHYFGRHRVEVQVNGSVLAGGEFTLDPRQ